MTMAKPTTIEDVEFANFSTRHSNLKDKAELLERRVADLEKMLAVAESRAERAEGENEALQARFDSANAKAVEYRTTISNIAASIIPVLRGEAALSGVPSRNGPNIDAPRFQLPRIEDSIATSITSISDNMRQRLRDATKPQDETPPESGGAA